MLGRYSERMNYHRHIRHTHVKYALRQIKTSGGHSEGSRLREAFEAGALSSKSVIAKKNYKEFSMTLQKNSTRLLASAKEDLA